jgi:hypothetical protein
MNPTRKRTPKSSGHLGLQTRSRSSASWCSSTGYTQVQTCTARPSSTLPTAPSALESPKTATTSSSNALQLLRYGTKHESSWTSTHSRTWTHHSSSLPNALVWPSIALVMLWWESQNSRIFRNNIKTASQTLSSVIQELSIWLYRFKDSDQKEAAKSWCDHLSACNFVT